MKNQILILFLILSFNVQAQHNTFSCDDTIHGLVHLHLEGCTNNVLITSLEEDGNNGTVINGIVETSETILIKPGYSFIRIIPEGLGRNKKPHTTKIGGGNTGGRKSLKSAFSINTYPNPMQGYILNLTSETDIIGYKFMNTFQKVFKEEAFAASRNKKIKLDKLKKGIYLLKIKLKNGNYQTKTIIKNY